MENNRRKFSNEDFTEGIIEMFEEMHVVMYTYYIYIYIINYS